MKSLRTVSFLCFLVTAWVTGHVGVKAESFDCPSGCTCFQGSGPNPTPSFGETIMSCEEGDWQAPCAEFYSEMTEWCSENMGFESDFNCGPAGETPQGHFWCISPDAAP